MPVKRIHARQIYDSRGNPTIEVDLTTERGIFRAAVPSGASTGIYEALELRDKADTWHGKGVMKAVHNVNNLIAPEIVAKCMDPVEQEKIDGLMLALDGTENKAKLGANAILGVSMAVCKAGAAHKGVPLYRHIADLAGVKDVLMPVPCLNVINGGSHAGNKLAMQEVSQSGLVLVDHSSLALVHGPPHRSHLLLRGHEDGLRAVPSPEGSHQEEVRSGRHRCRR